MIRLRHALLLSGYIFQARILKYDVNFSSLTTIVTVIITATIKYFFAIQKAH